MMNNEANAAFYLKLFEMLKDAQNGTQQTLNKQSDAIASLMSYLKEGVQLDEIKKMIEDHDKEAVTTLTEIDTCTEAINKRSESLELKIVGLLQTIKSRIDKTLIVITVVFSLMAISYLFVKNNVENMIDAKIGKPSIVQGYDAVGVDQQILSELKNIRDDIKRLHPEKK